MDPYIYTSRMEYHRLGANCPVDGRGVYLYAPSGAGKKSLGTKDKQLGLWRKKPPVVVLTHQRWLGGMLTNWTTIKTRVDRLKDLERREKDTDLLPKRSFYATPMAKPGQNDAESA